MSEKLTELFEEYGMDEPQTQRGRGAILFSYEKKPYILKQLDVNESRVKAEYKFKEALFLNGFSNIDKVVKTEEEELIGYDRYGTAFVMREYFEGREINLKNIDEVLSAVENLGRFHIISKDVFRQTEEDVHIRPSVDFKRRNKELKRVKNFILKQKSKKDFEIEYLNYFEYFYAQGKKCEEHMDEFMQKSAFEEFENKYVGYCHGQYDQHAVLINKSELFTTGFDRFFVGNQLYDIYHLMRKTIEKNDYSKKHIKDIIDCYHEQIDIDENAREYIYLLFSYPEKFYKLSNQYINLSKSYISPKMLDKLRKLVDDEEKKKDVLHFLRQF